MENEEQYPRYPEGYYVTPDNEKFVPRSPEEIEKQEETDKELRLLRLRQKLDRLFKQISEALKRSEGMEEEITKSKKANRAEKEKESHLPQVLKQIRNYLREVVNPEKERERRLDGSRRKQEISHKSENLKLIDQCIIRKIERLNEIFGEIEQLEIELGIKLEPTPNKPEEK